MQTDVLQFMGSQKSQTLFSDQTATTWDRNGLCGLLLIPLLVYSLSIGTALVSNLKSTFTLHNLPRDSHLVLRFQLWGIDLEKFQAFCVAGLQATIYNCLSDFFIKYLPTIRLMNSNLIFLISLNTHPLQTLSPSVSCLLCLLLEWTLHKMLRLFLIFLATFEKIGIKLLLFLRVSGRTKTVQICKTVRTVLST